MSRSLLALILLLGAISLPARAQFTQYTAPGTLAKTRQATAEQAKASTEQARWKLGKVAVDPRLSLRNVGYYRNVFATAEETDEIDDYRATLAAGLAAHLNLGPKSIVSGYLVPEYSWWRDQTELSQLNVNWGAGWFGFFNRLTVNVNADTTERERPLSDEIEAPVTIDQLRREARLELALTDYLTLFTSFEATETRHSNEVDFLVPGLAASELDRDEEALSAGAILKVRRWQFGAGLESTEVNLLNDPAGRSNQGESPFGLLRYDSHRVHFNLTWLDREIEFDSSELGTESLSAGSALVRLDVSPTVALALYGARSLSFAAIDTSGYAINSRRGASVDLRLGQRLDLTLVAEVGTADYRAPGAEIRADDLEALGGRLRWRLTDGLALGLTARDSTWDSNLNEFDRSQSSFGIDLELRENLFPW